jgi:hypothetical protein
MLTLNKEFFRKSAPRTGLAAVSCRSMAKSFLEIRQIDRSPLNELDSSSI